MVFGVHNTHRRFASLLLFCLVASQVICDPVCAGTARKSDTQMPDTAATPSSRPVPSTEFDSFFDAHASDEYRNKRDKYGEKWALFHDNSDLDKNGGLRASSVYELLSELIKHLGKSVIDPAAGNPKENLFSMDFDDDGFITRHDYVMVLAKTNDITIMSVEEKLALDKLDQIFGYNSDSINVTWISNATIEILEAHGEETAIAFVHAATKHLTEQEIEELAGVEIKQVMRRYKDGRTKEEKIFNAATMELLGHITTNHRWYGSIKTRYRVDGSQRHTTYRIRWFGALHFDHNKTGHFSGWRYVS